jgi:hypothetical protein
MGEQKILGGGRAMKLWRNYFRTVSQKIPLSLKSDINPCAIVFCIAGFFAASTQPARTAVEFSFGFPEPLSRQCAVTITGQISQLDVEAIQQMSLVYGSLSEWGDGLWWGGGRRVCLDSPGGNYIAAIQIARLINRAGLSTFIPANAICLSACSVIFMAGASPPFECEDISACVGAPSRIMHPSSRLGFHVPNLSIQDGQYTSSEVERAYMIAVHAVAELLRDQNAWSFPQSLLIAMLETPAAEMFMIETVRQALLLKIEIEDVQINPNFIEASLSLIAASQCAVLEETIREQGGEIPDLRSTNTRSELLAPTAFGPVDASGIYAHSSGVTQGIIYAQQSSTSDGDFCVIEFSYRRDLGSWSFGGIYFAFSDLEEQFQRNGFYQDDRLSLRSEISTYYSGTRISDLPVRRGSQTARSDLTSLNRLVDRLNAISSRQRALSCWLTSPIARITNVNEYTNLRRQPDFSAPVIRQVPLGERVRAQRADNITIIGQERVRQSCISACQAFGRNPGDRTARDRAQQCIQDNMLWYEITDARGNRGWVSRRFLEEVQ